MIQSTITILSFIIIVSAIRRFNKVFIHAPNLRGYHIIKKIPYFNENQLLYILLYFGLLVFFTLIGFVFGNKGAAFLSYYVSIILGIFILLWLFLLFLGFLIGFLIKNKD
jgi:hypothetical protein